MSERASVSRGGGGGGACWCEREGERDSMCLRKEAEC